jgi:hypothetical protein
MDTGSLGFDHINRNAPVLIRTPKLTRFEPAQYWGGGPPGNSVVLNPLFLLLLVLGVLVYLVFLALGVRLVHQAPLFPLQDAFVSHPAMQTGGLVTQTHTQRPKRTQTRSTWKHQILDSTISTVMHRFSSEHRS